MDFSQIKQNLEKKGYKVRVCASGAEAREYIREVVGEKSVGMGGSVTLRQIGLFDALAARGEVFWHWRAEDKTQARLKARGAQVYIASLNAISEGGELVNIDGEGNRVSETFYGHERVIFALGRNKIAPTLEAALYRARNVAAPLNARRLGRDTPCAKASELRCFDCQSKERICKGLAVFWEAPKGCEYEVVLIDEDLGF